MSEFFSDHNFYTIMQIAVGPVVMISGVGLLILALTNQYGRVIDRARKLNAEYLLSKDDSKKELDRQISIVWKRARILRQSLTFGILCLILTSILIFSLFIFNLFSVSPKIIFVLIFTASILALIACLISFARDITISLHAVEVELNNRKKS